MVILHYLFLALFFASPPPAVQATLPVTKKLNIEYGVANGQSLKLDAFLPDDSSSTATTANRPAIVFVHGGGWTSGHRADFHGFANWFAERGFVSFSVGYRLVNGKRNTWPAQIDDVQLAVRWIRAHADEYRIDPNKIGSIGGSAGGHLVSLLAVRDTRATGTVAFSQFSSKVNCAVDFAGPTDFAGDIPTTATSILDVRALVDGLLGGPLAERPEVVKDASPIYFVTSSTVPILIVHGDKDTIVPVSHATRFHEALKKAGADSTLVILPDEGHGLKPENDRRLKAESLKFYRRVLNLKD